jgi:hypothetical protein
MSSRLSQTWLPKRRDMAGAKPIEVTT